MRLEISSRVAAAIVDAAMASPDAEICGLLVGEAGQVTAHLPCRNVAEDARRAFEIDPGELIAALRAERGGGPAIIGCYHSHPGGSTTPSPRDAAAADANGWVWLIAAGGEFACWRSVADGPCEGRFEPVGHHVVQARSSVAASLRLGLKAGDCSEPMI